MLLTSVIGNRQFASGSVRPQITYWRVPWMSEGALRLIRHATVKDYFGQRKFTHAWQFFRAGNFPVDEEFGLNVWAPLHGEKRLLVVPKDSSEAANDPYDEFIEADVNQKVLENAVISPPGCTVIFHDNLIHCGIGAPLSEWGARSDVDRRFPGFVASTTRSSWSVYYDEQKGWRLMNSLREQWLTEERARELQKKAAAT